MPTAVLSARCRAAAVEMPPPFSAAGASTCLYGGIRGSPPTLLARWPWTPLVEVGGRYITSVDRFTEGRTPLNVFSCAAATARLLHHPLRVLSRRMLRHSVAAHRRGRRGALRRLYAIDPRMRARPQPLLAHAVERKAVLIYLPGFPATA